MILIFLYITADILFNVDPFQYCHMGMGIFIEIGQNYYLVVLFVEMLLYFLFIEVLIVIVIFLQFTSTLIFNGFQWY